MNNNIAPNIFVKSFGIYSSPQVQSFALLEWSLRSEQINPVAPPPGHLVPDLTKDSCER
jgi:hypothetical protein